MEENPSQKQLLDIAIHIKQGIHTFLFGGLGGIRTNIIHFIIISLYHDCAIFVSLLFFSLSSSFNTLSQPLHA